MKREKKTFGRRLLINVSMTVGLIVFSILIPAVFLVIAGDIYFSDIFNFAENLQLIADYGLILSVVYTVFLIAFALCCLSIWRIRTGWTIWLAILSIVEAAWVVVLTVTTYL
jgi:hypothetical protein